MAVLLIDPIRKRTVPIRKSPFLVGRQSSSDYQILSPLVSRTHCTFVAHEGGMLVWDSGSRNGTLLNNRPLDPGKPVQLQDGDRLVLGANELIVRIDPEMDFERLLKELEEPPADARSMPRDPFEQAEGSTWDRPATLSEVARD